MKFVLQSGKTDLEQEMYRQKEYYDWLNIGKSEDMKTEMIVCTKSELDRVLPNADLREWCPVGTVEFCVNWYSEVWGKTPMPKNVPDRLIGCCSRKIIDMEKDLYDSIEGDRIFVKDKNTIKSKWNGIKKKDIMDFCDSDHDYHFHFQVSQVIPEIYSEWRCFVYNGMLIDIKNYDGDPFNIPSRSCVERLISEYGDDAPVAYTLDICQCSFGTEVVEVHDFFACGLYGFSDPKYPLMLWRWFREFTS